jgi:hypothetical protein
MQLCKTCRSLMIGQEAPKSLLYLRRMLQSHGAFTQTVEVVAQSLGPMCDKCIRNLGQTLDAG